MKSVASAPAKVILFGEHFIVYGGKAILCAIDKRITVESEIVNSDTIQIDSDLGSITVSKSEPVDKVDAKFRSVIFIAQKMLKQFNSKSGLKISIRSEIPAGVGLGSSSACCVASAGSIAGLFTRYSKQEILNLALEGERTVFERASGADTASCTFGGIVEYTKQGTKNLDLSPKFQLIIANSKIVHSTSDVVARVKQFKESKSDEFAILCDNESALIEEVLDALEKNNSKEIGEKMTVNQAHLQKIGVSNKTLDLMLQSVKAVSYGAKLTGAGDGGCIIVLVDESNLKGTLNALSEHECFATKIDTVGVEQKLVN
ncbi:MAG: mevalonate kinase [Thaumarchaeota archaeon]|nr:mevalonate kinase [Nitrososphaerota archaeon]